jgi:hypothetical protein
VNLRFPVPPVCTALWTPNDWLRWIEAHGLPANPPEEIQTPFGVYVITDDVDANGKPLYERVGKTRGENR